MERRAKDKSYETDREESFEIRFLDEPVLDSAEETQILNVFRQNINQKLSPLIIEPEDIDLDTDLYIDQEQSISNSKSSHQKDNKTASFDKGLKTFKAIILKQAATLSDKHGDALHTTADRHACQPTTSRQPSTAHDSHRSDLQDIAIWHAARPVQRHLAMQTAYAAKIDARLSAVVDYYFFDQKCQTLEQAAIEQAAMCVLQVFEVQEKTWFKDFHDLVASDFDQIKTRPASQSWARIQLASQLARQARVLELRSMMADPKARLNGKVKMAKQMSKIDEDSGYCADSGNGERRFRRLVKTTKCGIRRRRQRK